MLIHADADAFFASVAARDDPSLRGVPFVVAAGVVACPSYAARAIGIHSGMPTGQALRISPGLRVVDPAYGDYEQASADLFALFRSVTSWVEPGSMEEAFLDVRPQGLDPVATARDLRERARRDIGLPVSMGVGMTKLMAKVASRRAKPDGLVVISRAEDAVVRRGLRLDEVWGVGATKVAALRAAEIHTVADLEGREVRDLAVVVGTMIARRLAAVAAGTDDAMVRKPGERRSSGASRTINPAVRSRSAVEETYAVLVTTALGRLGQPRVEVTRIDVDVRYDDGDTKRVTRRLDRATDDPGTLRREAFAALTDTAYEEDGRGVSLLGVGFSFRPMRTDPDQMALPF